MSDAGTIFISERFRNFFQRINTKQIVTSSHHDQSNGWVEVCIKFIMHTMKKCLGAIYDINITLLLMRITLVGPGLPSATVLFNIPKRGLMSRVSKMPVNYYYNEHNHCTLNHGKIINKEELYSQTTSCYTCRVYSSSTT